MEGEEAGNALVRGMVRNGCRKVNPGWGGQQVDVGVLLLHWVARQHDPSLSVSLSPMGWHSPGFLAGLMGQRKHVSCGAGACHLVSAQ